MTCQRSFILGLSALAAAVILSSAPLGAAGGGGGSMPSSSAPRYDPTAEYRKGIEALQAQQFGAAEKSFKRVLEAVPRDANTNYLMGLAKLGQNEVKAARDCFARAVRYDDKLIGAHEQLGITLARLGEAEKAREQLDWLKARAAACAKTCADQALLDQGAAAVQGAIDAGKQAMIERPSLMLFASGSAGDGAYLQAVSLINERRYAEAIESLEASQKAFGPHPDILTYLGFANRKLHRYAVAEAYYRRALAVAPGHRGATEYYGELMVERGDLAGAKTMLARLDEMCSFGCAEADELRRWIALGSSES